MWRFIRRLFVLLVLFTIIFLIYSYISPVGASNFVKKIKAVPQYISNMFDSGNELIIVDETVSMTWDMKIESNNDLKQNEEIEKEDLVEDDTRLEELNKEIEQILLNSEILTWDDNLDAEDLETEELEDEVIDAEEVAESNTWENIVAEKEVEIVEDENNQEEETQEELQNAQDTEKTETEEKSGLSVLDYEQIRTIFGNLID